MTRIDLATARALGVKANRSRSEGEEHLLWELRQLRLPEPQREYYFEHSAVHPVTGRPRRWKADFAWPGRKLLVEVEGGTWVKGRRSHTGGQAFEEDCEKYNAAVLAGWRLLRFTTDMVTDGRASRMIERALKELPPP